MKIGANLPVRHGEVLPVSCKPGYSSTEDGESNVRCFNGTIKADKEQQLPICLGENIILIFLIEEVFCTDADEFNSVNFKNL